MANKELTSEEIQKRDRMRKNLRLLALAAACYYFISAGFSFYEDSQAEKVRVVKEIDNAFSSEKDFTTVFATALNDGPVEAKSLPDGSGFYLTAKDGSSDISSLNEDGKLAAVIFEAPFDEGLSKDEMLRLRAFLKACENSSVEETIDKIIEVLKLDKTRVSDLVDGMGAGSKYVQYTMTVIDGKKVQIKAVRHN